MASVEECKCQPSLCQRHTGDSPGRGYYANLHIPIALFLKRFADPTRPVENYTKTVRDD